MNIFKILANGHGTISETNVSAFLGYLLDPKADHALGYKFLNRFLHQIVKDKNFDPEDFEYKVFYEQAFSEDTSSKQIVDIVVVCYSLNLGDGKQSFVKSFLNNTQKVNKIFLIENKIKASSITSGQLEKQFKSTLSELKDNAESEIYSIFLTPEGSKFSQEFDKTNIEKKTHIFWNKSDEETTINSILTDILEQEGKGNIEPLNEYTLHTLKAFKQFIETGFLSEKQEESIRRNDGTYIRIYEDINLQTNIKEKLSILKAELESLNPEVAGIIYGPDLKNKMYPRLYIKINGIILDIPAPTKTRDVVNIKFQVDKDAPDSIELLKSIAKKLGLELKMPNDKNNSYCKTQEMDKKIKITNVNEINEAIKNAINLIKN